MLKVLIDELARLPNIELTTLLDWRCTSLDLPEKCEIVLVTNNQCAYDLLPALIANSDCVWPIAPETNFILQKISALVEENNKILLNSSAEAVSLCSDKLATFQHLKQKGINTVDTMQLDAFSQSFEGLWVIKPKYGVGCLNCYIVSNKNEFEKIIVQLESGSDYIIQPYTKGDALSLSCLFRNGQARLLCCNQQHISIQKGNFQLNACLVNLPIEESKIYHDLVNHIAQNISGLWGYVGIDIILPVLNQPLVLEINPRLTTSYAGIGQALGINTASIILDMIENNPVIKKTRNKQHLIKLEKEE